MKSKFGTALALATVIIAGTVAAAINTQALNTPTQSTLGSASTTLLPADQVAEVVPTPTQARPDASVPDSARSQTQSTNIGSNKSASPNFSATSVSSSSNGTLVVFENPNHSKGSHDHHSKGSHDHHSKGGDDQDDDEGLDNDGDDD